MKTQPEMGSEVVIIGTVVSLYGEAETHGVERCIVGVAARDGQLLQTNLGNVAQFVRPKDLTGDIDEVPEAIVTENAALDGPASNKAVKAPKNKKAKGRR